MQHSIICPWCGGPLEDKGTDFQYIMTGTKPTSFDKDVSAFFCSRCLIYRRFGQYEGWWRLACEGNHLHGECCLVEIMHPKEVGS